MKPQFGLSLVILAVLAVPPAWSQTGGDQSQSGSTDQSQSGSTDQSQPSSPGPQVAYTHPEQLPPLTLLNEVTANTGIRLSLLTGFLLNYNSYSSTTGSYWQNLGLLGGGLEITQFRPTLMWDFNYNGGISTSTLSLPKSSTYLNMHQNARAKFLWQLSPHWQLAANDAYIYTNDPFEPYVTLDGVPTFNNPNPVIYIPQAVTESNVGSMTLTYQMGARDSVDFTGGESFQRWFNSALSGNNSYTYSGGSNYQHQFSARFSAGGGYSFTALDYGHGLSRSGIQGMVGFVTYQLSPSMSMSGFAGPEYTASKDIVPTFCFPGYGCFGYHAVHEAQWSAAEGATFAWSRTRNAVRAGFRHQNSDGGGLLGTVRLYQITASYRRSLAQRWNFTTGISYNNSLSVSQYRPNGFSRTLEGTANLSRNISEAWNATVYYTVIQSDQNYVTPLPVAGLANGVGISLRYSWGHSLGR